MNYVNSLMKNYPLDTEFELTNCSPIQNILKGGADPNNINVPTGGFPPIHLCDKDKIKTKKLEKPREYIPVNMTVSLLDIMNQRRIKK
jgi:hypothetical protein